MLMREMLRRCAQNFPNKSAYICGSRRATWREMDRRSDRFAIALQQLGVTKGTAVSILTLESIVVYEHFFACMKIGAIRVGINTQYAWPEIEHILQDSATRVILVDARCPHLTPERRAELESKGIRLIGYNGAHDFALDYETLLAQASQPPVWPALEGDDLVMYSYTSGTTGVPKGVMLTQEGAANVVVHCIASFGFSPDDVWYMPAASAWVVIMMNVFSLGNGMTSIIPDGTFQIQSFLRDMQEFRVTSALMVPTMIRRAIAEQRASRFDLSSWRMLIYGSSPATPQLIRDAREEFKVTMVQTYGQTETTGGWLTVLTEEDHKRGLADRPQLLRSIGRVGVHYECSVRDENGHPLPPNTRGEIWLRGNSIMKGYLNLPEATAEALRDDWLRSNDIGAVDDDGYVYLHDRQKFMIITGAVNVFPATVEAVLSEHPAVQEIAVVGVPHPEWGEAVVAVVVPRPEHKGVTGAAIAAFCDGKLSRPETPKHVVFVDDMPKTLNGKLKKNEIKHWLTITPGLVPWSTDER